VEYRIAVFWQANLPDGRIADLISQIAQLGLDRVRQVRVSGFCFLRGDLPQADLERLSDELLADPVVKGYRSQVLPFLPEWKSSPRKLLRRHR